MTKLSLAEVIKDLNFPVSLRKSQYTDAKGKVKDGDGMQVIREDKNVAIASVSDTYGLKQHGEALKPILAALDGMEFDIANYYMDHEGRSVMVKALSKKRWTVGEGDEVAMTLLFVNAYNRTHALKIMFGAFRVICSNGLVVSHPDFKHINVNQKIVHSKYQMKKFDAVALGNSVAHLYGAMEKQAEVWARWKKTQIKTAALEEIKEKVLLPVVGKRSVDEMVQLAYHGVGQNGTLSPWALYNGVTEFYSRKQERSNTPVASQMNFMNKSEEVVIGMERWMNSNTEQLVMVNG